MDTQELFAQNLKRIRGEQHITQEELAKLAGMHRTYIGGIEQKRVNVSLRNIGRISDALGVEPEALFAPASAVRKKKTARK